MSRIGKKPIPLPKDVTLTVKENLLKVKGSKGELTRTFQASQVKIENKDGFILVTPTNKTVTASQLWGLTRTLVSNMIVGVSQTFVKAMDFNGVGYRAAVNGDVLTLNLGYSHPIDYKLPKGITAKVNKNTIEIVGADKELVGFVSAQVRSLRPPEPYKGKGIKYSDEKIIKKAGKTGAKK